MVQIHLFVLGEDIENIVVEINMGHIIVYRLKPKISILNPLYFFGNLLDQDRVLIPTAVVADFNPKAEIFFNKLANPVIKFNQVSYWVSLVLIFS